MKHCPKKSERNVEPAKKLAILFRKACVRDVSRVVMAWVPAARRRWAFPNSPPVGHPFRTRSHKIGWLRKMGRVLSRSALSTERGPGSCVGASGRRRPRSVSPGSKPSPGSVAHSPTGQAAGQEIESSPAERTTAICRYVNALIDPVSMPSIPLPVSCLSSAV
jgi:hypothetical protein